MTTPEHRKEKRHPFHWPVAIVFDSTAGKSTYHGVTHEVSLLGCSMLTEHNIFSDVPISILLSLPANHPHGRRRVLEVKAHMIYTVLAAGCQKFRCGIRFLSFKGEGRATLKRVIEQRAMKADF